MKSVYKKNENGDKNLMGFAFRYLILSIIVVSAIIMFFYDSQDYSEHINTEIKKTESNLDKKKKDNYNNKSVYEELSGSDQVIHKTFYIHSVESIEDIYKLQVDIPYSSYTNYSKIDESERTLTKMVTPNDPVIENISKKLVDLSISDSDYFYFNNIFELANNIKYSSDYDKDEDGEYWKFPIETLVDGEGDCEDTTFLLASIFEAVNLDTILIEFPGHIGIAIELPNVIMESYRVPIDYYTYKNKKYYYIETTNTKQFHLSEIPIEFKKLDYKIHPATDRKENHDSGFEEIVSNYENDSNWKEYVYLDNKFKIEFSSVPTYEIRYYGSAKYDYYNSFADNIFYSVTVLQSEAESIEFATLEEAGMIALEGKSSNSKIISKKKTEIDGSMAYEILIGNGNIYTRSIETVSSGFMYSLNAMYDVRNFKEENINKFFNSFKNIK